MLVACLSRGTVNTDSSGTSDANLAFNSSFYGARRITTCVKDQSALVLEGRKYICGLFRHFGLPRFVNVDRKESALWRIHCAESGLV